MRYDYLLVVGPGRSGSDFLYRILLTHPDLAQPEIKEGYCYRTASGRRRAQELIGRNPGRILPDIANLAYKDPALLPGLARLHDDGCRILLVVLLRDHYARAVSMMRFRRSRGEWAALWGRRRLEQSVLQDRLTPDRLQAVYAAGADVLTIGFPALTSNTDAVLDALASVCGIAAFPDGRQQPAGSYPAYSYNEAMAARSPYLAAAGKLAAIALRRLGLRRTLQNLKDSRRVNRLFLKPLNQDDDAAARLTGTATLLLEREYAACCELAASGAQMMAEGVYFRSPNRIPSSIERGTAKPSLRLTPESDPFPAAPERGHNGQISY